jgi:hypothetical protein
VRGLRSEEDRIHMGFLFSLSLLWFWGGGGGTPSGCGRPRERKVARKIQSAHVDPRETAREWISRGLHKHPSAPMHL